MLSDLFDDPNNSNGDKSIKDSSSHSGLNKPPPKRRDLNLSGIINQGATCYLNTLIQTLLYTTEFRDSLFSLTAQELGISPNFTQQQQQQQQPIKQRVILIELQRLFAQLMLLDQEACSTNRLTDSFGWSNNEEMQQHDVQELNRILFSAIEQSLVNTRQSRLIQKLYRGTCVNKIQCLSCLNVAEREEEFLDWQVTVQGSSGLRESLQASFAHKETLTGSNQYKCERCGDQYKDAEKYCQLKTLPLILTLSLLRFTYDLRTYQRIKETGRFEFPLEIDLADFMENRSLVSSEEYTKYELFSVIIHSGSAYGGHYHTYIKDVDRLGKWTLTDEYKKFNETTKDEESSERNHVVLPVQEICLVCNDDDNEYNNAKKELVNLDYIKYESPLELLKAYIYNKFKYELVRIDAICADLPKTTGTSWNKRFKSKHGTFEKFLRRHEATFELSADSTHVKLRPHDRISIVASNMYNSGKELLLGECLSELDAEKSPKKSELSERDEEELNENESSPSPHWFDFDDSRVTPIFASTLLKQFEGKESAYMLFYRRKQQGIISTNSSTMNLKVPDWLLTEIAEANASLTKAREDYQKRLNAVKVECYLDSDFYLEKNILNLNHQCENRQFCVYVDRRDARFSSLREALIKHCVEQQQQGNDEPSSQARREICLSMLLDEETTPAVHWLLARRVSTGSGGARFSYFVHSRVNSNNKNTSDEDSSSVSEVLGHHQDSFLILSKHHGLKWPMGEAYEPLRVVFRFFDRSFQIKEISYTFVRSTPLRDVRREIAAYLISEQADFSELGLSSEEIEKLAVDSGFTFSLIRAERKNEQEKLILEPSNYDSKSLAELSIKNGDFITVESEAVNSDQLFSGQTPKPQTVQPQVNRISSDTYSNRLNKISIINCLGSSEYSSSLSSSLSSNFSTVEVNAEESELVSNIKLMALSVSENAASVVDMANCHLRYINENSESLEELKMYNVLANFAKSLNLNKETTAIDLIIPEFFLLIGQCLHDDSVLGELAKTQLNKTDDDEHRFLLTLCPGRAPIKSSDECVVKCYLEQVRSSQKQIEVLVELNSDRVSGLVQKVIDKLHLEQPLLVDGDLVNNNECYYLKKLDWLGDVEAVLNNLSLTCAEAGLAHNQKLLVTKGKLIPPNHYKIKLWLPTTTQSESVQDLSVNDLLELKSRSFKLVEEIVVCNEKKLAELQMLIQFKLMDKLPDTNLEKIRLRSMKRLPDENQFQLRKVLFDFHKSLKQLSMSQETDLCVQILNEDDQTSIINQGIILLDCVRLNLKTRLCEPSSFKPIAWDVNNGASLNSLRESLLKAYSSELVPSDLFRVAIAKRLVNKFQWILLNENGPRNESSKASINCNNSSSGNRGKKKNKQQSAMSLPKSNLKAAPYSMEDGDLIAFALLESDAKSNAQLTAQDLLSDEDLLIARKSNMTKAEFSRIRKEIQQQSDEEEAKKKSRRLRPEVGITIKIDNFN